MMPHTRAAMAKPFDRGSEYAWGGGTGGEERSLASVIAERGYRRVASVTDDAAGMASDRARRFAALSLGWCPGEKCRSFAVRHASRRWLGTDRYSRGGVRRREVPPNHERRGSARVALIAGTGGHPSG